VVPGIRRPKYRNPENAGETGRAGMKPRWLTAAIQIREENRGFSYRRLVDLIES